jgi:hypothetical protein
MELRYDHSAERPQLRLATQEGKVAPAYPRRSFMIRFGKKAAWVAPVVVTLAAQPAFAGGSNPSGNPSAPAECSDAGELCSVNSDCCSSNCQFGICQ